MINLKSRKGTDSEAKLERLRSKLKIDPDALDEAVMQQPVLFDEVAEQATLLASRRDEAKSSMESLYEELSLKIRFKFKGEKITNDEVAARVGSSPKYKDVEHEYARFMSDHAQWSTLRESFMQRGYMLREMCGLYASGYWGQSSVKGGAAGDAVVRRVRDSMRPVKRKER